MTYSETLDFMFAQLPMYHRIGAAAYKADIQPTIDMMDALGNPQRKFCSIHVAGTNGKGSVSHMLASILQEAGFNVGLYTSPHLVDFRERIRINGEMIPQSAVVDFITAHCSLLTGHSLSFFEMTVGMAFDYFAREQVDVAVVEVGMGGRLDSTNVMPPFPYNAPVPACSVGGVILSVITNIGLDHTQFLGDTLEKIAAEKAGIIKDFVPVVIGETQPETQPVFDAVAESHSAPISYADQHYVVDDISLYTLELTGEYQKKNIATVLQAVETLNHLSPFTVFGDSVADIHLSPAAVRQGLARVVTNTHLQGRWQTIATEPLTICETAHNEPGIRAMIGKLQTMQFKRLHLVYGCVNDKDFIHILELLNTEFQALKHSNIQALTHSHIQVNWYFTQPSVPRALPVDQLVEAAARIGISGQKYSTAHEAVSAARNAADPEDFVLVTGSIFLVADVLNE